MIKKYSCEHGLDKCFDCLEKHHIEEVTKLVEYLDIVANDFNCDCCDGSQWSMLNDVVCKCLCHEALRYLEMIKVK